MRTKNIENNIKESQVEEALVANLDYLRRLLGLDQDLRLIARQLRMHQGEQRLDLLLTHGKELCLVELKVTEFDRENLLQTVGYRSELELLQASEQLVQGSIRAFLLVTNYTPADLRLCGSNQVILLKYEPIQVLENYFQNLAALAPFMSIKPNDYGVFSLGLMNRTLQELANGETTRREISDLTQLSVQSVGNHLRVVKSWDW